MYQAPHLLNLALQRARPSLLHTGDQIRPLWLQPPDCVVGVSVEQDQQVVRLSPSLAPFSCPNVKYLTVMGVLVQLTCLFTVVLNFGFERFDEPANCILSDHRLHRHLSARFVNIIGEERPQAGSAEPSVVNTAPPPIEQAPKDVEGYIQCVQDAYAANRWTASPPRQAHL